jgi:hypothetical protein
VVELLTSKLDPIVFAESYSNVVSVIDEKKHQRKKEAKLLAVKNPQVFISLA